MLYNNIFARRKVFVVVIMKFTVFFNWTPCNLLDTYQSF